MPQRIRCALLALLLVFIFVLTHCRAEFRSFDGTGNNPAHPEWGAAETAFARLAPADYADGVSVARLNGRPNPRAIGVALSKQLDPRPNARRLSGYVYAFGNLLSHDSQLTLSGSTEVVPFTTPLNDDMFFPNQVVRLTRSRFDETTGTGPDNPRQQMNFTTAFIDASQIYGPDELTASILRGGPVNPGAKLVTSNDINGDGENLLPRNAFGPAPNAPFVAGDGRVNDNIVLTGMHTLFMREHNRLVDSLTIEHPDWSSDELFQRARKIVGAQMQVITYNEFLPAMLGTHTPLPTGHYDPMLNPAVLNEFPAVFLRIGHSMLTNDFKRILNDGQSIPEGPLPLTEAFEDPSKLTTSFELDLFLKGLSVEIQEEVDLQLVDGMRIALLDAIDIQRARDHGIPDYNTLREAYGLQRVTSFAEITSNSDIQNAMAAIYGDVDDIDPFIGALAEDHLPGASVGPLVAAAYQIQFAILRDGDRFWYEHDPDFTAAEISELAQTSLADIILRNTGVRNLPANIFVTVPEPASVRILIGLVVAVFLVRQTNSRFLCWLHRSGQKGELRSGWS